MSNVIIGLIAAILMIGMALAAATYLGPVVMKAREGSRVTDYLSQTMQLRKAADDYTSSGNNLVLDGTVDPLSSLSSAKAMKGKPRGGASGWALSTEAQALIMKAEGAAAAALATCKDARARAGIPNPNSVKKCDGSDGALSKNDPCCIG